MQLVINIDEDTYKDIKKGKVYSSIRDVPQESVLAIANGTPLPKGHGDLIDRRELLKLPIDKANYPSNYVKYAPTIIEKDGN
jgi:hypothetical protein